MTKVIPAIPFVVFTGVWVYFVARRGFPVWMDGMGWIMSKADWHPESFGAWVVWYVCESLVANAVFGTYISFMCVLVGIPILVCICVYPPSTRGMQTLTTLLERKIRELIREN